jgi:hypothetical protein
MEKERRAKEIELKKRIKGDMDVASVLPAESTTAWSTLTTTLKNANNTSARAQQKVYHKMVVPQWGFGKVVKERIYSVAWHPSTSHLIGVVGDKFGSIGELT